MGYLIGAIVVLTAVVWLARRAIDVDTTGRADPSEREPGGLWYGFGTMLGPYGGDGSASGGIGDGFGDAGGGAGGDCGGGGG